MNLNLNWRSFRAKLQHPYATLGLLIALQLTSSLVKHYSWLVIPRLVLYILIIDGLLFRSKPSADGSKPHFGLPWRLVSYVVGLLLLVGFLVYYHSPEHWRQQSSPQPLQPVAEIGEVEVFLGSDELIAYHDKGYQIGTISYYTTDGLAVAMAHASPALEQEDNPFWISLRSPEQTDRQWVQLLANDHNGVVLKLDRHPDWATEQIPIGGAADIAIGELAELRSVTGSSYPVRVQGYYLLQGLHCLIIQPLDNQHKLLPGMSGSPIIQNGKLIGCAAASPGFPNRGPQIGFARLAADIYAASSQVTKP